MTVAELMLHLEDKALSVGVTAEEQQVFLYLQRLAGVKH